MQPTAAPIDMCLQLFSVPHRPVYYVFIFPLLIMLGVTGCVILLFDGLMPMNHRHRLVTSTILLIVECVEVTLRFLNLRLDALLTSWK